MKKIILALLCIMLLCSLLGCEAGVSPHPSETTEGQENFIGNALCSVMALRCEINNAAGELFAISDGTGIIYRLVDSTAYLITNFHVIHNSFSLDESNLICETIEARPYGAGETDGIAVKCLWYSLEYDLAVLRVDNIQNIFPAAKEAKADSEHISRPLDKIIAVGNSNGSGIAVHSGHVARAREFVTIPVSYQSADLTLSLIRYDAAVDNGDSGGALYSDDGDLIGLINAKRKDNNGGYAIPASTFVPIIDNVIDDCIAENDAEAHVLRFGVKVIENHVKTEYDDETELPYAIYELTLGEPEVGSVSSLFLKKDDVLISVAINDDTEIVLDTIEALSGVLLRCKVGDTLTWRYRRADIEATYTLTVSQAQMEKIK